MNTSILSEDCVNYEILIPNLFDYKISLLQMNTTLCNNFIENISVQSVSK